MDTFPASFAERIAFERKRLGLSQTELARQARISRATLDALENGRGKAIGFAKLTNILTALGLELTIQEARSPRPSLEELLREDAE